MLQFKFHYEISPEFFILFNQYSFENCEVTFNTGAKQLNVNMVYRPPSSQKNKWTSKMFFGEFSQFMHDLISSTGQFLLLGDLNFHLEDRNDTETVQTE